MNFGTFSNSRLLLAVLFNGLLAVIAAGCKKDSPPPPPTAPVVTTAALTNISYNAATGGGSIVSDGGAAITASGIVWSKTNATPTLSDSVIAGTTATGTFTTDISGLEENSSYYIRAFATNSVGTGYGNVLTLNTTNDTNKVRFTYNGEEVVYGIIVSPTTGKKWLDRNLGAKHTADSALDYNAYGDLFQWGRLADGHQLINWTASNTGTPVNGISTTVATSDAPGNSSFIAPATFDIPYDWRDDNNSNRWVTNPQGPCPDGWHVPSTAEWMAEVKEVIDQTGNSNGGTPGGMENHVDAYNKLKLTLSGVRFVDGPNSVNIYDAGKTGYYWMSSDHYKNYDGYSAGVILTILGGTPGYVEGPGDAPKSTGATIRCIKN
jgi:uncharacterized protein (TIGR02145 family)